MKQIKLYNTKEQIFKTKEAFNGIKEYSKTTQFRVKVTESPRVIALIGLSFGEDVVGYLTSKYDESKVEALI